ncbi:hypothetical protein [Rhodococcoides fascians]|uniref:hypothetical protein n=1 Tax=Rhodococcoides fascians TaxID=1828 RepID=UPI000560C16A|nr:hypothetical protein [Rhodococcus fascians]
MNADCLLCLEVEGKVPLPGGVYETPMSVAFHLPEQLSGDVLLGYHLVVPKRHVHDHGGLDENEVKDEPGSHRVDFATAASFAERVRWNLGDFNP